MERTLTELDRALAARLIGLYNDEFVKVFAVVKRNERDEALRSDLGRFFSGSSEFAEVLRDVVIGADGRCNRKQILRNLETIRHAQKIGLLHQVLSEVLDFILFSAGEAMGYIDERAFEQQVQAILAEAARGEGEAGRAQPASSTLVGVVDPRDPKDPLAAALAPSEIDLGDPEGETPPFAGEDFGSLRGSALATLVPYLPDEEAYQLATAIRAAKADATCALERAEQIASLAGSNELREIALRCAEHAASAIRALDQLEQRVSRLRRH